ncbi:MAG: NAD-dependent epimerase/dehydratase family protein [Candidatus Binatia bacterium]
MTYPSSILITGASGFLGGHLTRMLIERGVRPRVLMRSDRRTVEFPLSQVELYTGDLRDANAIAKSVAGVDVVYHCAALVKSSGRKEDFFAINVQGTENLLNAAYQSGVKRFVHVSSVAVYGPGQKTIIREDEEYDPSPQQRGYYTWSKIEADRLAVRFSREHNFPVTVLRPGIIYGPGAKPFFARLHHNLRGKVQFIIGAPNALLPLVFVESVAEAIIRAGQQTDSAFHMYNIVDGAILQEDLLQRHCEATGRKTRTLYLSPALVSLGARALEVLYSLLGKGSPSLSRYRIRRACQSLAHDTTKARKELGWSPTISLPQGLGQTWERWRQQGQPQPQS